MLFRKKRVELIEAFQYDGDFKDADGNYYVPDWAVKALENGLLQFEDGNLISYAPDSQKRSPLIIPVGWYIIRNEFDGLGFMSKGWFEDAFKPEE